MTGLVVAAIFVLWNTLLIVPAREEVVKERLGKFAAVLTAGFHLLIPFIDRVAYRQERREQVIDIPSPSCITKDNIQVEVDGLVFLKVVDSYKASYGIANYRRASINLAQTTMRSEIGRLTLEQTFSEREDINSRVVKVMQEVEDQWGVQVKRFEVKNIVPPSSVRESMEKQMSAERERRALISRSEGQRQSQIDKSEGVKMQLINQSEGEMQRRINEAEGRADAIETIGSATAKSIKTVAAASSVEGGADAVRLRLSQKYLRSLAHLADPKTKVVLPADLSKVEDLLASVGLSLPDED